MLSNTLDMMTFLMSEYQQELQVQKQKALDAGVESQVAPTLEEFVAFSRNYLAKENQPINVAYLPLGLGLRLQRGQTISFIPDQDERPMRDEGLHITRPAYVPGMSGISDMSGIPVFGGR